LAPRCEPFYLLFKDFKEVATCFPQLWGARKEKATVVIANKTLIIMITILNPKEISGFLLFVVVLGLNSLVSFGFVFRNDVKRKYW
jgi:hypothetical protein